MGNSIPNQAEADLLKSLKALVGEAVKAAIDERFPPQAKAAPILTDKLAVKPGEAARMLSVSRHTIWRLCATGKLKKLDCGVIAVEDIERFLREG
jgi:DNA-directed RNA polymerase specialized sigma24 family protein